MVAPPGVAVKVTGVAEQTGLAETAMETMMDKLLLTVMVMAEEVTGLLVTQGSEEAKTQVIASPLLGV